MVVPLLVIRDEVPLQLFSSIWNPLEVTIGANYVAEDQRGILGVDLVQL
jgi:hypothetical protein